MAIKNILLALAAILSLGLAANMAIADTAYASPSDGKTCTKFPMGILETCPLGSGIVDLSTAGYILIPAGSQCFLANDDDGEATTRKFDCNYDTNPVRGGVPVAAALTDIRDKAIDGWKRANPNQGNPTEGQIYTFINTNVYAEINPQEEDIINQDCTALTGVNQIKCEAIKSCVENDPEGNITNCTNAWNECMGGSTDEGTANECAAQLASATEETGSTCDIDGGLGWMICPMMNTMAFINDQAWRAIQGFLQTPTINTDTASSENGVYIAWSIMRNIANVAFVIVFIYIIFSQITNIGITNYGVKKMLPKLIIGALLVNTSFWITAILIDISNVLGSSVYNLFRGIADQIPVGGSHALGDAFTWAGVTGGALVVGLATVGIWLKMAVLAPLAIAALFSLLGILITLTLRHAIVVVLIVLAPLAFVAYLLPNTEKLFKAWWGLLKILLLIYPVIAFVFAIAHIAQRVVLSQAVDSDDALLQIFAVAIPAISIMLIPTLLKLTGGVLSKFGVGNPLGGISRTVQSGAKSVGQKTDKAAGNFRKTHSLRGADRLKKFANNQKGSSTRSGRIAGKVASVGGGVLAGVSGGGYGMQLKQMEQKSDAAVEAEQAKYTEGNKSMTNRSDDIRQSRIITSATEDATKQTQVAEFANKTDSELKNMAEGNDELFETLKRQRASSLASAANTASAQYANIGDADKLADDLKLALRGDEDNNPDSVKAQAITSRLSNLGTPGANALRNIYRDVDQDATKLDEKGKAAYQIMSSTIANNGALKGKVADVYKHATSGGSLGSGRGVDDVAKDGATWSGLSASHIAGQTKEATAAAIASGGISDNQLKIIIENDSVRAGGDTATLKILDNEAARRGITREKNSGASNQQSGSQKSNEAEDNTTLNIPRNETAQTSATTQQQTQTPVSPGAAGGYGGNVQPSGLWVPDSSSTPPSSFGTPDNTGNLAQDTPPGSSAATTTPPSGQSSGASSTSGDADQNPPQRRNPGVTNSDNE